MQQAKRLRNGFLALTLLAALTGSAQAWVITQVDPASGAGIAEAQVLYLDEDPGELLIDLDTFFLSNSTSGQHVLVNFVREASDTGIATIQLVSQYTLNMSGLTWDEYHVALQNDFNGDDATFIDPDDALAWQQNGGASRLDGTPISATDTQIDWATSEAGEAVVSGSFFNAPTNQLVLTGLAIDVSELGVGDGFQLREWYATPEPATMVVLTVGGIAAMMRRRRRSVPANE